MKSLGANRSRHLSDSCGPTAGPQEPICPLTPDPHATYLLTPTINHYGTLDPHMHHFAPTSPVPVSPMALQPDCLVPLNNQLTTSSTFPTFQFPTQAEQSEYAQQQGCLAQTGSRAGTLTSSMSMGMSLGLGLTAPPMISSGTATISSAAAAKMNRLPASLLDQLERHLPLQRDGFSTLQFHRRSRSTKHARSESPGRIRNLVHSVQKLFAKSQSLEGSAAKGAGGQGTDGNKTTRRSKSKDRAKTEGTKRRPRPNLSGFWSSDDALEDEATSPPPTGTVAVAYRNPLTMMTLGRAVSDSQAAPRHHALQGYNTIATHSLKSSKSSGDLKPQVTATLSVGAVVPPVSGHVIDTALVKRGSWSTLTLSQARQVLQKGTATVNRTLLKTKSCHQELACNFLQVPLGDWSGTLGRGGGGGPGEIPCRRMRSGSYVKAMGDMEDSEGSESPPSPKPSPKTAARRQSYLKATQHSLSEQQPPPLPRNCLPSLREMTTNRSLDNLDCLVGPSEIQHWEPEPRLPQGCSTLGRSAGICQVEQGYLCTTAYRQLDSHSVEALDLPTPTCFRSRSHSYLRAIQAGCSQDDDTASLTSDEPPTPPAMTNTNTYKKTPPPVPPRFASKPLIAVTIQSSTESAQDTYLDSQDQRSEANSQSGRSNSSDSVTSSRTGSLAKGAKRPPLLPQVPVPAPREPPLPLPVPLPSARVSSPPLSLPPLPIPEAKTVSITLTPDEPQALPRRKLSSIGIQVDCVQPVLREEQTPTTKFQSIGVQVEDGRPLSRFSSMASRQETTETESQDQSDGKPSEKSSTCCTTQTESLSEGCGVNRTQKPLKIGAIRSISGSIAESLDPALDPSSLPPPDPSLQSSSSAGASGSSVNGTAEQPGAATACLRDGHWFLKLLQAETGRMEAWCQQMEQESKEKKLSEEVLGKIRSAVGSAQLLMSKKFQQFRGLCEQNLDVNAQPRPTAQDLAGFWDLLQLSIEDISMKFDELHLLKSNDWKLPESSNKKEEKKQQPTSTTPKKTLKPKPAAVKEKSVSSDSAADKQRQEARKRLMAAKRAVSERQNSATESADSIEIYVPEAQTRL
ncbi:disks large-associated protein 4-like isoform X1 [Astyanax mexicanus]|uniref:Disks large-associated protein 4-like isoform X1 n=1 Tax=Astyanax mexicanus TaxID=7994 RepID=A0A8T2LHD0_ASTMX|nr:disks large-associated protein 4-like isoform X1 [Astyanax mexicanus]